MEKRYILRSLPLRLIAGGCSAEPEAACLVPIVWMNGGNCHNLHRRCSGIHRFRLPESDWKSRRRCWLFLDGFGIIDGGAYKGLWGGFVSYEAADYNVFCFSWGWCICLIVYILRAVFETECANSGITAGRLLLYLSVTDVLLRRTHTKRLHLSAGWFLLKLYGWGFVSYLMLRGAHHVLFLCLNTNVHEAKEQKKRKFRMELHHWVMSSFVSSVWFMISIMSSIGVLSKVVVR